MIFFENTLVAQHANKTFYTWKNKIESLLPFAEVEHIGSTAIPGALTKGDIDLLIRVPKGTLEDVVKKLIAAFQWVEKAENHRDSELCMLTSQTDVDLAFQVIEKGSKYEFFLRFRDLMRRDGALLARYNQLKRDCADLSEDEYRCIKSQFIEMVIT